MRSLRLRAVVLVAALALGVAGLVYASTVPGLRQRLVDQRLDAVSARLDAAVPRLRRALGTQVKSKRVDEIVRDLGDVNGVRVTASIVATGTQLSVSPTYDSFAEVEIRDLDFPYAEQAARSGREERGTETGTSGQVGEVSRPLFFRDPKGRRRVSYVVTFSTGLGDVDATVALVRRRIVLGAGVALAIALLLAVALAQGLTRRVRRLEASAQQVARGDFSASFPVGRADELGRLARTLEDMRRQLAELDSARKRFIATASHELRTPIFSLGGFLELLQDEELDPETRDRFLTQIRAQVDRLGKLAVDLLDLSRLEAGSLDLRVEPVDLALVARAVANEFEPALAAHDSRLELRLPSGPVPAQVDPERVGQVVRILIDNALTHTPAGTDMVVSAGRRRGPDGRERVRLGVGDFGPGVHRTVLPHIFEPFITSDDAQGSGLGLAIAHELAERMDGELRVESQPGRTTFTLDLPA